VNYPMWMDCCAEASRFIVGEPGRWMFNDEWGTEVSYCPFCGVKLPEANEPGLGFKLAPLLVAASHLAEPVELVFDLDGVLCVQGPAEEYPRAMPYPRAIAVVNALAGVALQDGRRAFRVRVQTARYMKRMHGDSERARAAGYWEAKRWLDNHGVRYDELVFGKCSSRLYVDDRGCRVESSRGSTDWLGQFLPALSRVIQESEKRDN
jgi:hypothetical protein